MLSLSLQTLIEAVPGLKAVGEKPLVNIKAAYALAKIKRAAQPALEDLEAARLQLCEKHAAKDADGKPMKSPDGTYDVSVNRAAFEAEWKSLLREPVQLTGCRALLVSELEGSALTPDTLYSLGPLVVEPAPSEDDDDV